MSDAPERRADAPVGRAGAPVGRADAPVVAAEPAAERPPGPAPARVAPVELPADVEAELARFSPRDLAIGVPTYNNAETIAGVAHAVRAGVSQRLDGVSALIVNADAGSGDGTSAALHEAGLPVVRIAHNAPLAERLSVPFHGIPGRGPALLATLAAAHRVGARALVLLEPDVVSITDDWIERLARPVLDEGADFVAPVYARHRYDGTITRLLMSPLVRALYGRRIRQPLGGQQALSARLVEHLLVHPRWDWRGRDVSDLWILGSAIADGFSVWEAGLGRRDIRHGNRTSDLPAMIAQTLGTAFALMHRHADLWREVVGSEPLPEVGTPSPPSAEPIAVDTTRMIEGFRLGVRDLLPIWEHIMASETLVEILGLDPGDGGRLRFPDDLWARVVYDFALGYHYDVVYREHLLRSFVPLYLGRTAAFVLATERRSAEGTEALLENVGAAFERQKPYLVDRWR